MSSPVTTDAAGAVRVDDDAAGLSKPLLANGKEKKGAVKASERYWVDVDQPDVASAADLEGGSGRPLLFRNRRVKNILLYPYR